MNSKYYLGIGGFAHDCAAAIFRNDELLAAAPEERFTRVKHQGGIPWNAIQFCLDWAGIEPNDVSVVCHSFWRGKMLRYASSKLWGSLVVPRFCSEGRLDRKGPPGLRTRGDDGSKRAGIAPVEGEVPQESAPICLPS